MCVCIMTHTVMTVSLTQVCIRCVMTVMVGEYLAPAIRCHKDYHAVDIRCIEYTAAHLTSCVSCMMIVVMLVLMTCVHIKCNQKA